MTHSTPIRPVIFGGVLLLACGAAAVIALNSTPSPVEPSAKPAAVADDRVADRYDHVMFGGTLDRNMVNLKAKDIPGKFKSEGDDVLWKADLGSKSYGGPIVSGGKVFVGTNNARPRNKRDTVIVDGEVERIDRGILMCFEEKTGKFLWQAVFPKLASQNVNDWPDEGICSTPIVEGEKIYFVSNRCTVVCADANGRANGVQGIKRPGFEDPTDADILWEYDMIKEQKVFPHNLAVCCPLIVGDLIHIVTANGVDEGHFGIPEPEAPSFIALDKNTGKLLWKKSYPGRNVMHGQWSNPTFAEIAGVKQVIFPGGDGWLYGLVPETGEIIWKFDCNPKNGVYELGGGTKNDFIATPVVYDNKVYIAVGQDPEHSDAIGRLVCISPTKKGDISDELVASEKKNADGKPEIVGKPNPNSCKVWFYGGEEKRPFTIRDFKFGRTMSTACIVEDILYLGDLSGFVHCFNAKTGEHYWQYDTKSPMWGSCFYVDGKVMIGNDSGNLYVFRHTKTPEKIDDLNEKAKDQKEARAFRTAKQKEIAEKYLIAKTEFSAPLRSTPVVANGVLYVMSENSLFAIKPKK